MEGYGSVLAIYAPMIFTAPYVMCLMSADPLYEGKSRLFWAQNAMFLIHDILGWIRIRIRILGSMLLTNGSGSGSWILNLLFSSLTFKMPAKNKFLTQFFLLITF